MRHACAKGRRNSVAAGGTLHAPRRPKRLPWHPGHATVVCVTPAQKGFHGVRRPLTPPRRDASGFFPESPCCIRLMFRSGPPPQRTPRGKSTPRHDGTPGMGTATAECRAAAGGAKRLEPLNKAASAPHGASQSLMRSESRERERPFFRASVFIHETRRLFG